MAFFEEDRTNYPRRWADMSFEFKCMFAYHISMMLLMALQDTVSPEGDIAVAATLVAVFTALSLRRRREMHWHWQGAGAAEVVKAMFSVALVGIFLFSTLPLSPPSQPGVTPWYLAGAGIGLIFVLQTLRLVRLAEADFLKDCYEDEAQRQQPANEEKPAEATWKQAVRGIFSAVFLSIWLCGVGYFYFLGVDIRDGASAPDAVHTQSLTNHGTVVYVTAQQHQLLDELQAVMSAGIPAVLLCAVLLHFIVGVRLFPNAPTLGEFLSRRKRE